MPNNKSGTPTRSATLRSGSASSITLSEIKLLLEEVRAEVIAVKDEMRELKETVSSLQACVRRLEDRNRILECKYKDIDDELQFLKTSPGPDITEIVKEVEDRSRRSRNFIIQGLPECSSSDSEESDLRTCVDIVKSISKNQDCMQSCIVGVNRIGRSRGTNPRLLKVQCSNVDSRNHVLRHARDLRKVSKYKDVFINPDRTPEQRQLKRLLKELREQRESDKDFVIFRDRMVHRQDIGKNFFS